MLFNSIEFAIFLPIIFVLYWILNARHLKLQNLLIVIASYIFYGWWDWRFLILIVISTLMDFGIGILLSKITEQRNRKILLIVSIFVNLGLLGFFKYFNFFVDSFVSAFSLLGYHLEPRLLNIILPVGISFYTFQTMSYNIDVYRNKLKPTEDLMAFAAFVSFFPQLVAGPIERANDLLPQFFVQRKFNYTKAVDGMRQILWGLFKKIVVADNCAEIANQVFGSYQSQSGIVLILGAICFAIQIYGDFSGYSDIAIGTARLFGINLKRNFNYPYFSRDIAEFWRRWHISLTTWFRDYLYIPMGGSRGSTIQIIRNTFVVFVLSGFWHGANLTFLVWGLFHALLFLPLIFMHTNRKNLDTIDISIMIPGFKTAIQISFTFILVTIGWIFFRSETIADSYKFLLGIFRINPSYFDFSTIIYGKNPLSNYSIIFAMVSTILLIVVEWFQRDKQHGLFLNGNKYNWIIYLSLVLFIYLAGGSSSAFIYFQF